MNKGQTKTKRLRDKPTRGGSAVVINKAISSRAALVALKKHHIPSAWPVHNVQSCTWFHAMRMLRYQDFLMVKNEAMVMIHYHEQIQEAYIGK